MKKILCLLLCILLACVGMSSCNSDDASGALGDDSVEDAIDAVSERDADTSDTDDVNLIGCWVLDGATIETSYKSGVDSKSEVRDIDGYVLQLFSNGQGIKKIFTGNSEDTFTWYAKDDILVFVYSTGGNATYSYSIEESELICKLVNYDDISGSGQTNIRKTEYKYVFFKSDANYYESLDEYYFKVQS